MVVYLVIACNWVVACNVVVERMLGRWVTLRLHYYYPEVAFTIRYEKRGRLNK